MALKPAFLEEPFYNSPRSVSGIATRDELEFRLSQRHIALAGNIEDPEITLGVDFLR
jgi:hypothetical protein